jgi:LuxR family transcriptional regulator, maltose regulon positive regulatory protein
VSANEAMRSACQLDSLGAWRAPVPGSHVGAVSRPRLLKSLGEARVTEISAPAGSGKTVLLRSWVAEAELTDRAARVPVHARECDPQRFWISVAEALRGTAPGSGLVRPLAAAPDMDSWAIVERLLKDLAALEDVVWLVIDDVHELHAQALHELELLVMRAPRELRFVLATRRDLRLGLHRLRLEGELTEIRADDLRFTIDEARALFQAAGIDLEDHQLALLHERTEGWAAGLRLAALSLAGHPDPQRFAAEFSGAERTVAEYLLAEVLERQSEEVRRLLLRTSVLDRVNGELADHLTGASGGERILQDLEQSGAFVTALDARRSWFRYHQMFGDLLQFILRRTAPGETDTLHGKAAQWYAAHGDPAEAIRHAQAARDWGLAARLLADHWVGFQLDGRTTSAHALVAGFPANVIASDTELTAVAALDKLHHGSLEEAERQHALAVRRSESVPAQRREHLELILTLLRLSLARQHGDLSASIGEAQRLLASADAQNRTRRQGGDDLRAVTLISLGIAETWSVRPDDANQHLEQGVALARRIGRPYLEALGLAHRGMAAHLQPDPSAAEHGMRAIELVRRHGWTGEPTITAAACTTLGVRLLWQGRLDDAAPWLQRAQHAVRPETDPVIGLMLHLTQGLSELARDHAEAALAAFLAAERLTDRVAIRHPLTTKARAFALHARVRLGQTRRAEQVLAEMDAAELETGEGRVAQAALRLAQHAPRAAAAALTPVLDGSVPPMRPRAWMAHALLVAAAARDALGDRAGAGRAVTEALDVADRDQAALPFLLRPVPELLGHHAHHGTTGAALIAEISTAAGGPARERHAFPGGDRYARGPHVLLTDSEMRILRYLPTNLPVPEIAAELSLSANTVRTHARHLYGKLGAHGRTEAVERARASGLLAPSAREIGHSPVPGPR